MADFHCNPIICDERIRRLQNHNERSYNLVSLFLNYNRRWHAFVTEENSMSFHDIKIPQIKDLMNL